MNANPTANPIVRSLALAMLLLASHAAHAIVISFTATDLPDIIPGEDLWTYTYRVTDATFASGEGFSIFFDPALYGTVDLNPPPVNGDWDVLTTPPSAALPAPGIYDAMALVNAPSLAGAFQVGFTWTGAGLPGAQVFERYDAGFTTIASGLTVPSVPEPGRLSLMLAGLGVLGLGAWGRQVAARRS